MPAMIRKVVKEFPEESFSCQLKNGSAVLLYELAPHRMLRLDLNVWSSVLARSKGEVVNGPPRPAKSLGSMQPTACRATLRRAAR
jgi:hypothetical protein